MKIQNATFKITGICIDPLNNGNVTYVPLSQLKSLLGFSSPNLVLLKVDPGANYFAVKKQIQSMTSSINSHIAEIDLNGILEEDTVFLSSLWTVIMSLPAFALASATLCLISFQMLTIDEQHQEFAVLRVTGAKPKIVKAILAVQSLMVLLASFAAGTSLGTIVCILILIETPIISAFSFLTISGWLLAALVGMFLLSLYPTSKFARKHLLEIMS